MKLLPIEPLKMDNNKMLIVALYGGGYTKTLIGHEVFNFEENIDGFYYGYIPPGSSMNVSQI